MSPGEAYWARLQPFWGRVDIYSSPQHFLRTYRSAPEVERVLFATHFCQSEARNGGLYQFFYNHTGILAPEACEGYRTIDLPEAAQILEEAMGFFGHEYPRDRAVRVSLLDSRSGGNRGQRDPFRELDAQFYAVLGEGGRRFQIVADRFVGSRI